MTRTGERNTPLYTTAMFRRQEGTRLRWVAALAIAGALCQHALRAQPPARTLPVTVSLTADPDRIAVIRGAAEDAAARYAEWLGPARFDRIEIVEGPGSSAANPRVLAIAINLPLLAPAPLMELESQVAYGAALGWLGGLRTPDEQVPLDQGLAWYLQSRIVERLFNLRIGKTAYSSDQIALFGGTVRWPLPSLRLSRWTAGLGRDVFLRSSTSSSRTCNRPAGCRSACRRMPCVPRWRSVRSSGGSAGPRCKARWRRWCSNRGSGTCRPTMRSPC